MSRSKKHWIKSAIKKLNTLRRTLKIKVGKYITESKLAKATHSKNKLTSKRARLAETLRKFH